MASSFLVNCGAWALIGRIAQILHAPQSRYIMYIFCIHGVIELYRNPYFMSREIFHTMKYIST